MDRESLLSGGVMMLYGDVGDPWGWGEGFTPEGVQAALVEHGSGDIVVRLNSGGGRAFDGVAIYSLLKAHPGAVTIQIDGIAASAASLIAMAGDRIEMREGAMMMIHDAAGFTFGNSAEHEKSAAMLNKLSEQYATVYALRSGKVAAEVRALMQDETWLSAADAIAHGLATGLIEDAPAPAAAFDYRLYAKAPPTLAALSRTNPSTAKAALAAHIKEPSHMTPEEIAAKAVADKAAADKAAAEKAAADKAAADKAAASAEPAGKGWSLEFFALAGKHGVSTSDAVAMAEKAPTLAAAKDALLDALAAGQTVPNPQGGRIAIVADGRDKFVAGVSQAVLAQAGIDKRDPANEFNGISPMDIIRECAAKASMGLPRDRMRAVAAVITNTGSDFSNITFNIAEKAMLKGYEETEETFPLWTSVGTLPDFKTARKVDLNALPALPQVTEASGFSYLTTGDRGESYSVATAGGLFSISRQAIVNDDLDVFTKIPMRLGRAAKRTIGNDVYAVLTSNPAMSDGNALFSTQHKNILPAGNSSALAAAALQAMDQAMALQKDRSNNAVALNLVPKHFIGPRALKFTALQLFRSSAAIGQSNPAVLNTVQNLVESLIFEARLDAASGTAFYLAADQNATDTIEVVYLNGQQTPFMEVDRPFTVDGVVYKVRLDYGVKAFAWEGLQKSPGA